ncbi:hypothetical protein ANCDUO_01005 [Ancylostoma duodenale]|uniref:Uncharacterized protein n=1 Tax=Ancylostoma duodenale TaxID=51022 RepID=A0A0C2E005_9BILA|nr:hypothetical protein ANCDUO_01005 [Ancylostoma duodenale]
MQARHDVIGLTETRRYRPLSATLDNAEELCLGTCDSRGVGELGILVNTDLKMSLSTTSMKSSIDLFSISATAQRASADGSTAIKRRPPYEVLELQRQHGAATAACNYQLTSELTKRCREAIKEPQAETSSSVSRSRKDREKHSQRTPGHHQSQG